VPPGELFRGRYRQVDRLAEFGFDSAVGHDAYNQLNQAVVIHVGAALEALRWNLTQLVRLRCPVCGRRHFFKPLRRPHLVCVYGWWCSLKELPHYVRSVAAHGDD
jgi:UDP-N-acetylmuramate-alanine ligase